MPLASDTFLSSRSTFLAANKTASPRGLHGVAHSARYSSIPTLHPQICFSSAHHPSSSHPSYSLKGYLCLIPLYHPLVMLHQFYLYRMVGGGLSISCSSSGQLLGPPSQTVTVGHLLLVFSPIYHWHCYQITRSPFCSNCMMKIYPSQLPFLQESALCMSCLWTNK